MNQMYNMDYDTDYDLGYNQELIDKCDYVNIDEMKLQTHRDKSALGVMQLNIRGLLGKQESLGRLISSINKIENLDVILLAETWLKKSTTKKVQVPGYDYTGNYRDGKKKGGGVGILIAKHIQWRERKDLTLHLPNFENKTIELKTHGNSILLSALYRPPNSPEKEFLKNYKRLIGKFTKLEQCKLILGTDHNLDFLKHHLHAPTKSFIDYNIDNCLLPTITKPTRITRSTATLIDNIIIGKTFQNYTKSQIYVSDISDHLPTMITMPNIHPYRKPATKVISRSLTPENIAKIKIALQQQNWESLKELDVNKGYDLFQEILQKTLDDITPLKEIKIPEKRKIKEDWLTPGLLKCLNDKGIYTKKAQKTELMRTN